MTTAFLIAAAVLPLDDIVRAIARACGFSKSTKPERSHVE